MDERDVQKLLGKPDEIVGRADRMRSRIWTCSSCGAVTHSEEPIQDSAPCIRCGGIAFKASGTGTVADHCAKCNRRKVVDYHVEPETAWKLVVLNRWRVLCASCFDVEAEKASVKYSFTDVEAQSWSERPPPRNPYKRKR